MRIAVVGSGIAGLVSAWELRRAGHAVTVYEARPRPALVAHAPQFELDGRAYTFDSLVIWTGYYRRLVALARALGLTLATRRLLATTFALAGEPRPYARYASRTLLGVNLALPQAGGARATLELARLWLTLLRRGQAARGRAAQQASLGEFFEHLPPEAYRRYVYPWLDCCLGFVGASLAERVPLQAMLEFYAATLSARPCTVREGLSELARRLLAGCEFRPATRVLRVEPGPGDVRLQAEDARIGRFEQRYEQVVLAVPPQAVARLDAGLAPGTRALFERIEQREVTLYAHTDATLLSAHRADWGALNYRLHADPGAPVELTIWTNDVLALPPAPPVFFSWNPVRLPDPARRLYEARLTRVMPTVDVQAELREVLPALQGRARVFYCGTWCVPGRAAYLEEGVQSAQDVAARLLQQAQARAQ